MARLPALRFERSASDRMLTGVAGGFGRRIGVEPSVLRLAIVVLALAGGAGIAVYLVLLLASTEDAPPPEDAREPSTRRFYALWVVVGGALLLLRETTIWPEDAIMASVGLGGFGSALLWTRGEGGRRILRVTSSVPAPAETLAGLSRSRIVVGAILVVGGMVTLLAANTSLEALRNVAFAVAVTLGGLALILGPWLDRLIRQLRAERHERIRSEERAEVAAHLHDSVLQTLALIQRSSDRAEMSSLARVQERELRSWLYGRARAGAPTMLSDALEAMASRIERLHHVAVESVLVGDATIDDALQALVDAAGEAVTNAAKHAGVTTISVYCEIDDAEVTLYVRDEGRGFDGSPPVGRGGIAQSIVGRMERNGGIATIRTAPAGGTEVRLVLPRRRS